MDRYLLSAPAGFAQGLAALQRGLAADDVAADLVGGGVRGSLRPEESQKIQLFESRFAARQVDLKATEIANVLRCINFITRGAGQHCEAGSVKSLGKALVGATNASDEVAAAIAQAWAKSGNAGGSGGAGAADAGDGEEGSTAANSSFSVGKLRGLDWKLGVRLCSSECDRLRAPFVRLVRACVVRGVVACVACVPAVCRATLLGCHLAVW
jgi:hypothetical protein